MVKVGHVTCNVTLLGFTALHALHITCTSHYLIPGVTLSAAKSSFDADANTNPIPQRQPLVNPIAGRWA